MGSPTWNFGGGLTYPCHGTGGTSLHTLNFHSSTLVTTRATAKHVHIILKMLEKMLENLVKSLTRESTAKTYFDLRLAMVKSQCAPGFTRNVKKSWLIASMNAKFAIGCTFWHFAIGKMKLSKNRKEGKFSDLQQKRATASSITSSVSHWFLSKHEYFLSMSVWANIKSEVGISHWYVEKFTSCTWCIMSWSCCNQMPERIPAISDVSSILDKFNFCKVAWSNEVSDVHSTSGNFCFFKRRVLYQQTSAFGILSLWCRYNIVILIVSSWLFPARLAFPSVVALSQYWQCVRCCVFSRLVP